MRKNAAVIFAGAIVAATFSGCVSTTAVESKVPDNVTKSDPAQRAQIHTERAAEYFRIGNIAVALDVVKQALSADGSYAPAHNMHGLIQMHLGNDELAAKAFQQALKLLPDDSLALNNYGWFLCQRKNAADALPYFDAALKDPLYATPESAMYNAGLCKKKLNDRLGAEVQFRAVVKRQPQFAPVLYELAEIEFSKGRPREAEALLVRYDKLTQMPTADALLLGAKIARSLGDKSSELSYVQQLRRRFPDSPQLRAAAQAS